LQRQNADSQLTPLLEGELPDNLSGVDATDAGLAAILDQRNFFTFRGVGLREQSAAELIDMDTIVRSDESTALSAVSWPAIFAGGVVTAALTLMLLALGTGLGLYVISPWSSSSISTTHAAMAAGIYLLVVAVLSSAVGGYLAGRLRARWISVAIHEVYFRDTAHGLLSWALATVVSAAFLGGAATSIVGSAASGGGSSAPAERLAIAADRLLRPDYGALTRGDVVARPGAALGRDISGDRADVLRLLNASLRSRTDIDGADRAYLVQLVAARSGLSAADADARVSEVLTQLKAAADTARRVSAQLALWLAASMLLGALAASLAATEGGGLREGTWTYKRI